MAVDNNIGIQIKRKQLTLDIYYFKLKKSLGLLVYIEIFQRFKGWMIIIIKLVVYYCGIGHVQYVSKFQGDVVLIGS